MAIPTTTRLVAFLILSVISFVRVKAQVGFGTTTPDPSAVVHIQDTAKGLLIPRMTGAQKNAIPNPAEGLMIYQTDSSKGFYYYTGSQWAEIARSYKQTLILTGDITNSEAAAKIASEVGPATQEIRIYNCGNLTSVDLSMISSLTELFIKDNPVLQSINLSNLKNVDGSISMVNCAALTSVALTSLETTGTGININATALPQINLPALKKVVNNFDVYNNPNLTSILIPLMQSSSTQMPDIRIIGNKNLASVSAPLLNKADEININLNSNCNSVSFPLLNKANRIEITNDSLLTSAAFPLLVSVSSDLVLINDTALTTLQLSQLTSVSGQLAIQFCKRINTISLPALTSVTRLYVNNNDLLASFSLPVLAMGGGIAFYSNPVLTSMSFPALTNVGAGDHLEVANCKNLTAVSFPSLTTVQTGYIVFSENKLPSAQINSLLNRFANIVPAITGAGFYLSNQTPPAPPTGQGITDKATLEANNNMVQTD